MKTFPKDPYKMEAWIICSGEEVMVVMGGVEFG